MKILAIETSCDDTCVSIVKVKNRAPHQILVGREGEEENEVLFARQKSKVKNFEVLSNVVSSQEKLHAKYGGVYPMMAKREHQRNLLPILIKSLKKAKILLIQNSKRTLRGVQQCSKNQNDNSKSKILKDILAREEQLYKNLKKFFAKYQKPAVDLIAVTNGPGLEPCLWTGLNFARTLSFFWEIPIVSANHIKSHVFVNVFDRKPLEKKDFPAVCLVVSGGHTLLFLMEDFGKYKILGETKDDAAGECFDKTARILGLGYPGGPAIATQATKFDREFDRERVSITEPPFMEAKVKKRMKFSSPSLPRPMIYQKNYDFSFSGLKTAVLYDFKKRSPKIRKSKQYLQEMSAEIQQAIIDVLIKKTIKAAKDFKVKIIILGGGVIANEELRKQFKEKIKKDLPNTKYLIPDTKYCTDNAVMTAITGYFRWKNGEIENWQDIKADANLKIC